MNVAPRSISSVDGSATVRLGSTSLVCGVRAEIASPTLSHPDEGFIVVNLDRHPCSSSNVKVSQSETGAVYYLVCKTFRLHVLYFKE